MADTVDSNVIFSGANKYTIQLIGISDGTGESDVSKIDISSLVGPGGDAPSSIRIDKIQWSIQGYTYILLEWDGSTDTPIATLSGNNYFDWRSEGGRIMDASGGTGDLLLTSVGAISGDTYDITIHGRLKD
jgi:hypothetical protein